MGSLQTSTCDYYWRGQSSLACPWKARAAVHGIAWWWSGDVGLRVPGRVTRPPQPPQPPPHNLKQKQRAWSLPRACLASLHPGPGHSALVGKPPICLLKKETPHTTYLSHRKGSIKLKLVPNRLSVIIFTLKKIPPNLGTGSPHPAPHLLMLCQKELVAHGHWGSVISALTRTHMSHKPTWSLVRFIPVSVQWKRTNMLGFFYT